MNKSILLLFLTIIEFQQSQSLSITVPNEKLKKRDAVYGDLSYSYSATDVGAKDGGHVKTVTVIKNISKGKHDYTNSDSKNIKLIVKWPEITADAFSTLDFFTSAATTQPKIESEEKIAETNKTESNNEEQNAIVETKTESVQIVEEEKKPEKQMEDVPKQDVELLEPSKPIGLNAAIQSAKAQAHAQYIRSRIDNAVAMGDTAKISEYTQRLQAPFIEDFSDFSMHTIRHLNNPKSQKQISVKIIKKEPYIAPILRTKIPK